MRRAEDLTGRRFGRYTVIRRAENRGFNLYWLCRCDCGTERQVQGGTLRAGTGASCGCSVTALRRPAVVADGTVHVQLTKGLVALLDLEDRELAQFNWSAHETNGGVYAARTSNGRRAFLHRAVAERAGMDIDGIEVDHRDGNRLDCRRGNLRPATHAQNMKNGRRVWLGLFDSDEAAAEAYANASHRLHGEFGRRA